MFSKITEHRWFVLAATVLVGGVVLSLPFERIPSWDIRVIGIPLTLRPSLLLGFLLILVSLPVVWERRKSLLDLPLLLLGSFAFSYFLSVLLSADLKRAISVYLFTVFALLVGLGIAALLDGKRLKWVEKAFLYATWAVLAFGFYQYFGDMFGLSTAATGLRDIYTKEIFGFPRIQSTGLEPLYYANFLLVPLLYFAASFLRGEDKHPVLLLLIVAQIILTVSRGAIIAGALGLIVVFILMGRKAKRRQLLSLGGLIILGVALALNLTSTQFASSVKTQSGVTVVNEEKAIAVVEQATNLTVQDDRLRNRQLAIDAFVARPLFGIGPGNFSQFAKDKFEGYRPDPGYIIVNNEPLELLAEAGLIGFSLFLAFVALLWWRLVRLAWKLNGSVAAIWPSAIAAYLVAMAVQYQAFSTLYIVHLWVVLGIGLALTTPGFMATDKVVVSSKVKSPPTKNTKLSRRHGSKNK